MPKITLNELALMVQRGFAEVHEHAARTDETLAAHTAVLGGLKADMHGLSQRMDVVQEDLGAIVTLLDTQRGTVSRLGRRMDDVEERVTTVEKHPRLQ